MADRTPEERERARLDREARRAQRQGRTPPPAPPVQPQPPAEPAPSADAPAARGVGDPSHASGASGSPTPPPATGREWRRAAGDPDPDPPLVRRVEGGGERERVHAHDEPLPEPAPRQAPTRRIPAPPPVEGAEKAIGTKRVSHRPHLPGRRGGGGGGALPPMTTGARPPSGGRVLVRRAGALLALALVAFVLWFAASLFQPFSGDGTGTTVVTIPKGSSLGQIADLLERDGVISSGFFFKLRAKLEGKDSRINSGRIAMKRDMSYAAALDALTQKPKALPKLRKVTIPEGRSRSEVAKDVAADGIPGDYLRSSRASRLLNPRKFGAPKGATLEGFLFPATYDLRSGATTDTLVAQQLKAFRHAIAGVGFGYARRKNLTIYDVLVIASMIEREAGVPGDRAKIAAVIYNRLKQGMPLGIDATLRFALNNWTKPLKVSELNSDTPYNTRRRTGLPPSPIGSPGLAAIRSAARPAKVPYLYYVVRPCGRGASNFSSTDAEFQRDVAAYNAKRQQLGGKSPVDC